MKALYIHGLNSSPNPKKLEIIESLGLEVVSPFIDYDQEKAAVYDRVKNIALENNVDLIIGSSLGGFIAFWLANDIHIPALLFNPALYFESMQPFIPKVDSLNETPLYVCLGEKDKQVNPSEVQEYLNKLNPHHKMLKILKASWLPHGIDLSTFRSMISWFLAEQFHS
jgi:predicted esterase YcpF (UPF0227 family)